jgi:hypothetical protein
MQNSYTVITETFYSLNQEFYEIKLFYMLNMFYVILPEIMQQPDGNFTPGLNEALKQLLLLK